MMEPLREELILEIQKERLRIGNKIEEARKKLRLISAIVLRYEKQWERLCSDRRLKQIERKLRERL